MGTRATQGGAIDVERMMREANGRGRRDDEHAGVGKLLYDLKYRRDRFRQFVGVALVFLLTIVGRPLPGWFAVGAVLACLGMGVRLWASGVVMKNEVLATSGPYGYVRHPLYVGNLLICAGFCLASGLWWSGPLSIAYLLFFYPQTIRREDAKLLGRFPEEWREWAARTRALVPSREPYGQDGNPTLWSLKRSMMRNGEPLHIVVLGACLLFLHSGL